MEGIQTFKDSWPWPWPWIRPYGIPSCITHRPLPIYQISFKSKKLFVDGRTAVRTDIFPPLILLGRLLEVDLKSSFFLDEPLPDIIRKNHHSHLITINHRPPISFFFNLLRSVLYLTSYRILYMSLNYFQPGLFWFISRFNPICLIIYILFRPNQWQLQDLLTGDGVGLPVVRCEGQVLLALMHCQGDAEGEGTLWRCGHQRPPRLPCGAAYHFVVPLHIAIPP